MQCSSARTPTRSNLTYGISVHFFPPCVRSDLCLHHPQTRGGCKRRTPRCRFPRHHLRSRLDHCDGLDEPSLYPGILHQMVLSPNGFAVPSHLAEGIEPRHHIAPAINVWRVGILLCFFERKRRRISRTSNRREKELREARRRGLALLEGKEERDLAGLVHLRLRSFKRFKPPVANFLQRSIFQS